jgi:hypothetical protein
MVPNMVLIVPYFYSKNLFYENYDEILKFDGTCRVWSHTSLLLPVFNIRPQAYMIAVVISDGKRTILTSVGSFLMRNSIS